MSSSRSAVSPGAAGSELHSMEVAMAVASCMWVTPFASSAWRARMRGGMAMVVPPGKPGEWGSRSARKRSEAFGGVRGRERFARSSALLFQDARQAIFERLDRQAELFRRASDVSAGGRMSG